MKSKFSYCSRSMSFAVWLAPIGLFSLLLSVAEAAPADNIAVGSGAGTSVAPNADNIDIGHPGGGASETKTIRIGTQGTQKATYIAGIYSVGIKKPLTVVIGPNGQLGTATAPAAASDENRNLGGTTGNSAAEGVDALNPTNSGNNNTATGFRALFTNTSGGSNTANGTFALENNTVGSGNTANGEETLRKNTTSSANTATGYQALLNNSTSTTSTDNGAGNTATGHQAMLNNTFGYDNTATGRDALYSNTTGVDNTGAGNKVLYNNTTGQFNVALGYLAGSNLTTGWYNINIGNYDPTTTSLTSTDLPGETHTIRIGAQGTQTVTKIAGIHLVSITSNNPLPVVIDSTGQLGTTPPSSERFKKDVKPMDRSSDVLLALKPVTFQYKDDASNTSQFGLVAEEVEKVDPGLVVRDAEGKVYTVRYEAVNAMLLNEFLKEHRKVEDLAVTIAKQQKQIEALSKGLEKVNVEMEARARPGNVASNSRK